MYESKVFGTSERYFHHPESGRTFFAVRCKRSGSNRWKIEEIDQKEVDGSRSVKVCGFVEKTTDINGYCLALVENGL